VENRGKIGGITILFSGLGMLALGATLVNSIFVVSIILVLWRATALAIFLLSRPPEKSQQSELSKSSYKGIFSQQSFLLYFVPWVMFSLVNYLSTYIELNVLGTATFTLLTAIETGLIAVFALVGGFFIDSIGRKRVAIVGFVMIGVGYAVLGLYPLNPFSWYFNIVADGIAWGFFFVIFVVTIWGDLSHTEPSDKYYALGVLPFFISKLLELLIGEDIAGMVSENALFSFIAFFLFLAVLPLIYAPETLPEKHMKERELKSYLEKARKEAEKYS
jgi:MFS family permease